MSSSPQTLSLEDRKRLAVWAADCAEQVLQIYESAVPADSRVRRAIDQARAFAGGELAVAEAVRDRGGDAGAGARDAPTPASKAAAYAAQQAAAVAHMGAHALGAGGYAAVASTLAAGGGGGGDGSLVDLARRQVAAMDPGVVRALSALPPVGEHRAGPLGPGRLSNGPVGEAIRALQSALTEVSTGAAPARLRAGHTPSPQQSRSS